MFTITDVNRRTADIQKFILAHCISPNFHLAREVTTRFKISRPAAMRHIHQLEAEGAIYHTGKTKGRHYNLTYRKIHSFATTITANLQEDQIYHSEIAPLTAHLPENAYQIAYHGFTEMFNNAIDHSEGTNIVCTIWKSRIGVLIQILDNGVGIFEKLKRDLNLEDKRHALIELRKGKVTTDPQKHSGEGIFFTSRACDYFAIFSHDLAFMAGESDRDLLVSHQPDPQDGTEVWLEITEQNTKTMQQVFANFTTGYAFDITSVPVKQLEVDNLPLVSRSQGKRLVNGLERFRIVYLDFTDVQTIGQAFADEVFRVFAQAHPTLKIVPQYANVNVKRMIRRVTGDDSIETSDNKAH